ncbi:MULTISPECIES: hypothetical protein [unclassified Mucilaginibacter]|uniref:hypothetical protein n=1 Tax=unclassified Mucilaginibacter TaxID=2617802 RepID=UPI000960C1AC|nr:MULTISPECIES: hypothetical protein [unclassified Mucilaginibacter]OJW14825.1 MAG: hypothetical protein BGO48_11635 [Mucilaginibacter sp. 44-25]PLW89479.1 MAG: hypothetical protein C0154_11275 [Mucilaginibacter sp.]PMP65464.1 MAG: hypothetical protein C0191_03480 [Mucilaginibacter sp.]HEK20279.1 hypothetical protein [Bacteroidota bacterium]
MKVTIKISFVFLVLIITKASAQNRQASYKADSAYYLLDTSKTLASDRIWHTYKEGLVKSYELEIYAPCLQLMNKPTFSYSSRFQQIKIVNEDVLKSIKILSLPKLIYRLKQFSEEDQDTKSTEKHPFYLYIIEPSSKGFSIVKTQLEGSGPKIIVN